VKPAPFRIVPTFSPRIWGTRSLAPIFPDKVNLAEKIGEAWLTDVRCLIANGPFATRTLGLAGAPGRMARRPLRGDEGLSAAGKIHLSNRQAVHPGASRR
jgi:hypothetical protein